MRFLLSSLAIALAGCGTSHAPDDAAADGSAPPCAMLLGLGDLGDGVEAIGGICTPLVDGPIAAVSRGGDAFELFHAHASSVGRTTTITLDRYAGSVGSGGLVHGSACTTTYVASEDGATVRLSNDLGLSPAGEHAHFGLRASGPPPDIRQLPSRAYVVGDGCEILELEVGHYAGSAMLDEDVAAIMLHGAVSDRLGLFRGETQIAISSGTGDVVRWGDGQVLAAVGSGHGAVALELWDAGALRSGPFPVRGIGSGYEMWPIELAPLEGRGIVGRSLISGEDDPHMLFEIRVEGDAIAFPEPTMFASSRFARVIPIAGTSRALLQHEGGFVVVE